MPLDRNIADCAADFQARNLPLHGLINNVGTENPADRKSKEGFDVSHHCSLQPDLVVIFTCGLTILLVCTIVAVYMVVHIVMSCVMDCCAANSSLKLPWALLSNAPVAGQIERDAPI